MCAVNSAAQKLENPFVGRFIGSARWLRREGAGNLAFYGSLGWTYQIRYPRENVIKIEPAR